VIRLTIAVAIGGPLVVVAALVTASGRGLPVPAVPVAIGVVALLGAVLVVTLRRSRRWGAVGVVTNAALAFVWSGYWAAPLAPPAPLAGELPAASPPSEMRLWQLPTGAIHRTAAFGYRGGAFSERRDFVMTATLVEHPRGAILIDTGFGRAIAEQLKTMPLFFRVVTNLERTRSVAEQLDAAGFDRARLRGVVLTHAHWDHVSGLGELPTVPVLVNADERRFIDGGGWITRLARDVGARLEEYRFDGGPYLGFPSSHDLFGDGSVVIVPAPGHTPGSVVVFVALPTGKRYAFVGDLVWQREGITEREERPWIVGALGDHDPARLRESLLRVAAIHARFPEVTLVAAHDPRGFATLPTLRR